jgi:hypothetical protein
MPCSLLKACRRFGGTFRFNLQGKKITQAEKSSLTVSKILPNMTFMLRKVYYMTSTAEACEYNLDALMPLLEVLQDSIIIIIIINQYFAFFHAKAHNASP